MQKIIELHYPNEIIDDKWKNRRVIFMAINGQSLAEKNTDYYDGVKNGVKEDKEVECVITLPLTGTLQDSQSHNWNATSYQSIIEKDLGVIEKWAGDKSKFGKIMGGFSKGLSAIGSDSIGNIGMVADMLGTRKPMLNPGQFQNYTGSSLRSFSFSFTFIPENKEERDSVIKIINAFKSFSSPSKILGEDFKNNTNATMGTLGSIFSVVNPTGMLFNVGDLMYNANVGEACDSIAMMSPFVWQIYVSNGIVNQLISLHTCACSNVSVTYGNDEKLAMYEDGMPKEIKLNLNFNECDLQFADNYSKVFETYNNEISEKDIVDSGVQSVTSGIFAGINKSISSNIKNNDMTLEPVNYRTWETYNKWKNENINEEEHVNYRVWEK